MPQFDSRAPRETSRDLAGRPSATSTFRDEVYSPANGNNALGKSGDDATSKPGRNAIGNPRNNVIGKPNNDAPALPIRDPNGYAKTIEDFFHIADTDESGDISQPEIRNFVNDHKLDPQVREAFELLHENFVLFANQQWEGYVAPPRLTRTDLSLFKMAAADNVLNDNFYAETILKTAIGTGVLMGFGVGVIGLVAGGPLGGLAGAGKGLVYGSVSGAIGGGVAAYRLRSNREDIRSINYFDLKEQKGAAKPLTMR